MQSTSSPPSTFIALYRGDSINSARLVTVSGDPDLVAYAVDVMLEHHDYPDPDPVIDSVSKGRARALRLIKSEMATDVD